MMQHIMPRGGEIFLRPEMEIFAQRLRQLRKEKKLKQSDMAELMGMKTRNYQRWEYGEIDAPGSSLIFLGDYFQVSADYLLGRTDKREVNR